MTDATAPAGGVQAEDMAAPLAYRRYALGLLLVVYMLNFLDRQVVNILAEPIKKSLGISDFQIGLMGGAAFGLLYIILGLPIARVAQIWNRPFIIAACLALWSGFTMACGAAQNFVQLCLARFGVGFGEAGCTPAAHSIIADDTPPKDRAFALSFYAMGTPLGGLLGLVVGAVVSDLVGWRWAFVAAGAPGVLFAIIVATTLKEPRQRLAKRAAEVTTDQATFPETIRYLAKKPTFWLMAFSAAISAFVGYGQAQFTASFFLRTHGAEVAQMAASIGWKSLTFYAVVGGLIGGLAGAFGSVLGGKLTDWAAARDLRAYATVSAMAGVVWLPGYVLSVMAPSAKLALLFGVIPGIAGTLWYGPTYAVAQGVVPPKMRPTAAALMIFIISFVGLLFGPPFTGAVSDFLSDPRRMGEGGGVQGALLVTAACVIPGIVLSLAARRTIKNDLES